MTTIKQITKPVPGKMYSFNSRYPTKEDARNKAAELNSGKHAYYTKVRERGEEYFDVRTEN